MEIQTGNFAVSRHPKKTKNIQMRTFLTWEKSKPVGYIYIYDLVPKGVHENRTKGVENKVDDTLKLVVFLECAQC